MLYGGTGRVLTGIALETVFTLLLDAINILAKTIATVRIALGLRAAWTPQNRSDRGVSWSEAARLLWPQTYWAWWCSHASPKPAGRAVLWAAPFAGGLLVAIPFCVLTADPRLARGCASGGWPRCRRSSARHRRVERRRRGTSRQLFSETGGLRWGALIVH